MAAPVMDGKSIPLEGPFPGGQATAGTPKIATASGHVYKMDPALVDQVLKATDSSAVSVKDRNKLYAALGRAVNRDGCPPEVLAKYTKDRQDPTKMFLLLKEWVADPSFGKITIHEEHTRTVEQVLGPRCFHKQCLHLRGSYFACGT